MELILDPSNIEDYQTFLKVKSLPVYSIAGRVASFPDEYAGRLGLAKTRTKRKTYTPHEKAFDYQRDITAMAIEKQRFAVFADCGLGKTLILLEYVRHVAKSLPKGKCILIVSPLMVIGQTIEECQRFYGDELPIEQVKAADLTTWLESGGRIGITNYDALSDETPQGRLGCLVLDESSMLKSMYGKWGQKCIDLGAGLEWKLCLTGTPAPNDRIEYGNHAVFLDQFPTLNAFLAKYFVNRGQTDNRWELKPHALEPFYRSLSHWCIFLSNPAVYGWKDNCEDLPPIHVHVDDVDLTAEQDEIIRKATGKMFATQIGGITGRTKMGQLAKGRHAGQDVATNKPEFIREMIGRWPDESTIVWCLYNDEQERIAAMFPDAANIDGSTPHAKRMDLIADFKAGRRKVLVSKPKILGFGLNLQICTRMVFSGLQDSYESYYQAVKRANRYGSTKPLHVHIPVTEIERPMIETVLEKAKRVQEDTEAQERIFHNAGK